MLKAVRYHFAAFTSQQSGVTKKTSRVLSGNLLSRTIFSFPVIDVFRYLIPEFPNTAHGCSQHGPATPWLTSKWPEKVIPMPETFTVMREHCLSQCKDGPHYKTARTVDKPNFTSLHCSNGTEQSFKLHKNVFEMERRRLVLPALCFSTSSPFTPALKGLKLFDEDNTKR